MGVLPLTRIHRPRIFYGWWIVLANAIVIYYGGGTFFYGFGIFFNPIREHFAWSAATTALAFSIYRLEAGIATPVVGFLLDRLGPRRLMLFGTVVVGLGFLFMSRINSLATFYAAFVVVSLGFSFSMGTVGQIAVVNWFVRKRGKALGFLMMGAGLAGTLAPGLAWLVGQYGWRTSLVVIGVGAWVIGLPLALVVRHRPEQYGMLPDGDAPPPEATARASPRRLGPSEGVPWQQAVKTRVFWLISMGSTVSVGCVSAAIVLLVPHLEDVGIPPGQASLAITMLTLTSLVGRLGLGWLGDRVDKRYLLAFAFVLQSMGFLTLAFVKSFWMVAPFLLFFGPGYGGSVPLRPALLADHFGRRNFGTILGLSQTVIAPGAMLGPLVAARIFDVQDSYQAAWLLFSALVLLAAIPVLLARPLTTASRSLRAS